MLPIPISHRLNQALTREFADPFVPSDDTDAPEALAQACRGDALEGYALALCIIRLHDASDDARALPALNAQLLSWHTARGQVTHEGTDLALPGEAWSLVLAHGLALAALHSESTRAAIDVLCKSLIALLSKTVSADSTVQRLRLRGLTSALSYSELTGNLPVRLDLDAIAAECISLVAEPCVEEVRWWTERTLIEIFTFPTERRAEPSIAFLLERSEQALARHPDPIARFKQWRNRFEWARLEGDLPQAERAVDALQQAHAAVGTRRRAYTIVVLRAKAALAIDANDSVAAERFTRDAIAVADGIGAAANQRMAIWTTLVLALVGQDRVADAAAAAETASTYALAQHREILHALAHLLHARAKWASAHTAAIEHLQTGMQLARRANYSQFLMSSPKLAAWLAARALDHEVETAFVNAVIVRRQLVPPRDAGAAWPWAVRVRVLGGFSVEGPTVNLAGAGKTPQKPLEVIQLLAISGPKGVDRANLARAVYGSALIDSPATLNMALSRARRLLGDDTLIETQGGRIRLNAERVYVDLWAVQNIAPTSEDAALWHCKRLLDLYVGPLLHGSANADKHRITTATLRDQFVALIVSLCPALTVDQAIDVLRQAIAREPVAEPLYRALIERLGQRGDAADAVEVYRQCELALSRAYGVAPSERTQRLIETIRKHSLTSAERFARR